MDQFSYVVNGSLGAVPVNQMLMLRTQPQNWLPPTRPGALASDRPVLTGNQQLQANVLYESSNNVNVRYYLPLYRTSLTGGKPDVELRYSGGADDGDVGQLTMELTWDAPPVAPGIQLRTIDHIAELELRFLIPIQGQTNAAGKDSVPLQPLQQEGNGRAKSVTVFPNKAQFDAVYQAMVNADHQAVLHITIKARVGVRTWRQVVIGGMVGKEQQADALERRGALFTQVLNRETLSTMSMSSANASLASVTMKAADPAEQNRVSAVRTMMFHPEFTRAIDSTPPAKIEPKLDAAVASPVFTVNPSAMIMGRAAIMRSLSPMAIRMVAPALRTAPMMMPFAAVQDVAQPVAQPAASFTMAAQPSATAFRAFKSVAPGPTLSMATLSLVNAPELSRAIAITDLQVENRAALPTQIALGNQGDPAIIDTELTSDQEMHFYFDAAAPATHDVYATEGFVGGIHLLLPLLLTAANGHTYTVFQDNLMRDVIHVAPAEFRLVRSHIAPFLPGLTILPADFATSEHNAQADILFQVVLNYRLEPWIDPDTLELARAELARQGFAARFTPILPKEAKLTLELDLLGAGQSRDGATVEPASGITDTLVLGSDAFTNLWRNHLAQPSVGIAGRVSYRLFDGSDAQSSVAMSFWQTSTDVFDVDFLGPSTGNQPGRYRVRVRNKIESPVTITRLPTEVLGSNVVANALDSGAILNKQLKPQESVEIEYQVTPPDTTVVSIVPLVFGTVEPNLNALLKVLMVSPGFNSMSFTVPVKAADGVFANTQGAEPLTGLLVEFDDGTKAKLTAEAPATEVSLVGRLADQLMGKADDQHHYFYRVTNLHPSGEGARTSWHDGHGSDPLVVGTAVVQLDI